MIAPAPKPTRPFAKLMQTLRVKQSAMRVATARGWATLGRWWAGQSEPSYSDVRAMVTQLAAVESLAILHDIGGNRAVIYERLAINTDADGDGDTDFQDLLRATTDVVEYSASQLRLVVDSVSDDALDDNERQLVAMKTRSLRQSLDVLDQVAAEMPSRPVRRAAKPLHLSGDKPRESRVMRSHRAGVVPEPLPHKSVPQPTDARSAAAGFNGGAL